MADLAELIESLLDSLPEGIACASHDGRVRFWNRAAETITGHTGAGFVGQTVRAVLERIIVGGARQWVRTRNQATGSGSPLPYESLLRVRHRLGHELPVLVRVLPLADGFGDRIGDAVVFHPAEKLDALPRGESSTDLHRDSSRSELQDLLEMEHADFLDSGVPFGLLWITVDQAERLRKTHGTPACEAMVERMERTLMQGLRPTEQIGRWDEGEFLVLSHERTADTLAAHAQALAGLARTTDFRWWGDRISLTVSIGAAQAARVETVPDLLERAQTAMLASFHAGGNRSTLQPRSKACLPS